MKRIILLCLSLLLMLGWVCSCTPKSPATPTDSSTAPDAGTSALSDETAQPGDQTTTGTSVTTEPVHVTALPAIEEPGYVFLAGVPSRSDFMAEALFGETEDGGDVFASAVIRRNGFIEENLNVTLEAQYYDRLDNVTVQIQSGTCAYDLFSASTVDTSRLMLSGYFLDWSRENLPYVDPEAEWSLKALNDELSINGHAYYFAGDFNLSMTRFTYCYFFNQQLLASGLNMSVQDMYDIVNGNEWTMEKLNQMVRDIHQDIGTTPDEKDDDDIFGYVSNWWSAAVTYNYAFNNPVMVVNEEGYPELNENFYEKGLEVVDAVHALFFENPGSYVGGWGERDGIWRNGHSLFIGSIIGDATGYLDNGFTFGVVPYPMLDSEQDRYYTMVDGAHGASVIPFNIPKERLRNNSIIIAALNAETRYFVSDVYFEQVLKIRSFQEDEAGDVLDLLLASRTFDFGYLFSNTSTGFPFLIQHVMASEYNGEEEKKDFTSMYEQNKTSNVNTYNSIIQQLVNLAGD